MNIGEKPTREYVNEIQTSFRAHISSSLLSLAVLRMRMNEDKSWDPVCKED